jgi:hypothetical protein
MKNIRDYNADLMARAERCRARALFLKASAEMVDAAWRHESLEIAQDLDELADIIERFRFAD